MKFGLRLPGAGPFAGPSEIRAFSQRAEELGFDSLWMTDHVALPVQAESKYPYREDGKFFWPPETDYLDCVGVLTWASAATSTIKVGSSVIVAGWHDPIMTAKRFATLDHLNGGRTIMAVGTGWMREQFEMLHWSFDDRGPRTTEWIRLVRHIWTEDSVDFHGDHFDYSGFKCYPKPKATPSIPIWSGGKSDAVLRRVAAVADGWHPLFIAPDELERKIVTLQGYLAEHGRSLDDITLSARPVSQATLDAKTVQWYADLGVELLIADTSFDHDTIDGALDEMTKLADQLMVLA